MLEEAPWLGVCCHTLPGCAKSWLIDWKQDHLIVASQYHAVQACKTRADAQQDRLHCALYLCL